MKTCNGVLQLVPCITWNTLVLADFFSSVAALSRTYYN